MTITTIDGAAVAYDATTDVTIVTTVDGVGVAWQEAAAGDTYIPRVYFIM